MLKIFDIVSQVSLLILGCIAISLVSAPANFKGRRWGYVIGLLSQPFWFYTTWYHQQFCVWAMCWVYTAAWAMGVWNYFRR